MDIDKISDTSSKGRTTGLKLTTNYIKYVWSNFKIFQYVSNNNSHTA